MCWNEIDLHEIYSFSSHSVVFFSFRYWKSRCEDSWLNCSFKYIRINLNIYSPQIDVKSIEYKDTKTSILQIKSNWLIVAKVFFRVWIEKSYVVLSTLWVLHQICFHFKLKLWKFQLVFNNSTCSFYPLIFVCERRKKIVWVDFRINKCTCL